MNDDKLRKLIREKIGGRVLQKGTGDLAKKMKEGLLSGLMSKGAAAAAVMDEQLEAILQEKRADHYQHKAEKFNKKGKPRKAKPTEKRIAFDNAMKKYKLVLRGKKPSEIAVWFDTHIKEVGVEIAESTIYKYLKK